MNTWENTKSKKTELLEKGLEHFKNELNKIRSNKISIDAVKDLQLVNNRGEKTSIKSLATLKISPSSELVIRAFEPKNIPSINKAILLSNLGYNLERTSSEQSYFTLSPMTGEIRERIIKSVSLEGEETRKKFRIISKDVKSFLKKESLSQDQKRTLENNFDKLMKDYFDKISNIEKEKIENLRK